MAAALRRRPGGGRGVGVDKEVQAEELGCAEAVEAVETAVDVGAGGAAETEGDAAAEEVGEVGGG